MYRPILLFFCSVIATGFGSVYAKKFEVFQASRTLVGNIEIEADNLLTAQQVEYYHPCSGHTHPDPTIPEVAGCDGICLGAAGHYMASETVVFYDGQDTIGFSFKSQGRERSVAWTRSSQSIYEIVLKNGIEQKKQMTPLEGGIEDLWPLLWCILTGRISVQACEGRCILNRTLLGLGLQCIDYVEYEADQHRALIWIALGLTSAKNGNSLHIRFTFRMRDYPQTSSVLNHLVGIDLYTPVPERGVRYLLAYLRPAKEQDGELE